MLCQYCNQNPSRYHFVLKSDRGSQEIHLCPQCAAELGRQYNAFLRDGMPPASAWTFLGDEWGGGSAAFSSMGQVPETDEDFASRRRIAELEARLEEAVEHEEFETAAELRDEINQLKADSSKRISIN